MSYAEQLESGVSVTEPVAPKGLFYEYQPPDVEANIDAQDLSNYMITCCACLPMRVGVAMMFVYNVMMIIFCFMMFEHLGNWVDDGAGGMGVLYHIFVVIGICMLLSANVMICQNICNDNVQTRRYLVSAVGIMLIY